MLDVDKYGDLLLTASRGGAVAVVSFGDRALHGDAPATADERDEAETFRTDLGRAVERARWHPANDALCSIAFAHRPELWLLDLEACDEDAPAPATTLRLPGRQQGVFDTAFIPPSLPGGGAVLGAGADGKLYVWDPRAGAAPKTVFTAAAAGGAGARPRDAAAVGGGAAQSATTSYTRVAAQSRGGGGDAALSSCAPCGAHRVLAGRASGQVALFDLRQTRSAAAAAELGSAPFCPALAKAGSGRTLEKVLPANDCRAGVCDLLPSPHIPGAAVALLQCGSVIEVDLRADCGGAPQVVRVASPWVPDRDGDAAAPPSRDWRHRRLCWSPVLRVVGVPWPERGSSGCDGAAVLDWPARPFAAWHAPPLEQPDVPPREYQIGGRAERSPLAVSPPKVLLAQLRLGGADRRATASLLSTWTTAVAAHPSAPALAVAGAAGVYAARAGRVESAEGFARLTAPVGAGAVRRAAVPAP